MTDQMILTSNQIRTWRVIQPLNNSFTKVVDYKNCRLRNRDSEYNQEVAQKITKQRKLLGFEIGDTSFTGDDPIAIIDFVPRLEIACE